MVHQRRTVHQRQMDGVGRQGARQTRSKRLAGWPMAPCPPAVHTRDTRGKSTADTLAHSSFLTSSCFSLSLFSPEQGHRGLSVSSHGKAKEGWFWGPENLHSLTASPPVHTPALQLASCMYLWSCHLTPPVPQFPCLPFGVLILPAVGAPGWHSR